MITLKKALILCAVGASLLAAPALAGNKDLKNAAGDTIRIACKNSGCDVKLKKAGERKYARVEKTKGGNAGYKAVVAKYEGLGFK